MLLDVSLYLLLLVPSAIPCSLSSLISRIHSCLFLDWRHTVSSKFCDTQALSIFTEEVVVLRHARCVLSRLCYNRHSLLLAPISLELAESKIFLAALADTRLRTPLISFCTVQLRTLCVARSLAIFCLCTTSGPGPEELLGFWGLMVFHHPPILRKGSGNNNNSKTEIIDAPLRSRGS